MKIKRKLEEQRRMQRIWKIYEHPLFIEGLVKNKEAEKERIFCHHDMNHFLDVARLMYIFSMERGYAFGKEEIYATALLHDIGKWQQYKAGVPHEIARLQNQRKSGTVYVRHGQMLPHRRVHFTVWKMPRGVRMKMRDIPYLMNPVKRFIPMIHSHHIL